MAHAARAMHVVHVIKTCAAGLVLQTAHAQTCSVQERVCVKCDKFGCDWVKTRFLYI